ncbi:hypothetical protein [Streptomyces litchfieldiae]|uniref:Secreted protein n=1 Tax=Streptomyces litchfieldiae TaxID=3075543 RepID=A0ABU2MSF0_9ACTN|nr:hypothetical protein [Streptomyces sp. DSM 44938]MDT0344568.1 hypothetical protein [Streptomyces sp. DSM 44938]
MQTRRIAFPLLALAVPALLGAAPAAASAPPAAAAPAAAPAAPAAGWEPAPSAPWELPAGARCDFPISGVPVVDEVVQLVTETHPDGSPKTVVYKGDLVIRVTNLETGAAHDADASGSAVVEYAADSSASFWYVVGPVLVGVGENGGNVPRGLYIVDGVYTLDIGADGYKTIDMVAGTTDDICAHID